MEELKKFLNPLFFVIIIICFFVPFFNITCQQQKIASITGFELITGTTISTNSLTKGLSGISTQQNDLNKGLKTDTVDPEPLAIIALLIAIIGLIFSFFGKFSDIGSAIAGLLGGLSIFFLNTVITDNLLGKINYQPLAVECGTGFYIVIILFIILLLYNAYLFSQRVMYKPDVVQSYVVKMRLCPQCGSENDMVSMYCNTCGKRMEDELI
jgi:Zn finger protein HypA/HybF involved in hydrogenase expression